MLFNGTFEAHRVRILSCFGLKGGAWFTTRQIFLGFQLFSLVFCIAFCMQLVLLHPLIANIFQCVCTHPIDLMGIHLLSCVHGNKRIGTHDVIYDTFVPMHEMLVSSGTRTITCASFNHI